MTAWSRRSRNTRGDGLPSCGTRRHRADLGKATAKLQDGVGNARVLVETRCNSNGVGQRQAGERDAERQHRPVRTRRETRRAPAISMSSHALARAAAGSAREVQNQTALSACREFLGQHRHAVRAERKRKHGTGAGGRQCGVEVREVIAAARDLPPQRRHQATCVSNWINTRSCLAAEVLGERAGDLLARRQMDNPSRSSSAEPMNTPLRHASSHAARGTTLKTNCRAVVIA